MIIVVATITSKPGKRNEIISKSQKVISKTRMESGCISYELMASTEDENVLVMVERWENMESLQAHMQTPHFQSFGPSIEHLMARELEIEIYRAKVEK